MKSCEVPALDIDKILYKGRQMSDRSRIERKIVANLCNFMSLHGFSIHSVWDGEELERPKTTKEAMELIFNLDESSLRFQKNGFKPHGVYLVLGNDGWDVIADWNYTDGDPDGFNARMDEFSKLVEDLAGI